jgi:hypothetical protein
MAALVAAIHVFRAASRDADGGHNGAGRDHGVEAASVNVSDGWYEWRTPLVMGEAKQPFLIKRFALETASTRFAITRDVTCAIGPPRTAEAIRRTGVSRRLAAGVFSPGRCRDDLQDSVARELLCFCWCIRAGQHDRYAMIRADTWGTTSVMQWIYIRYATRSRCPCMAPD